ncbi:hypothetical protein E2I00_003449, partial [Balaenoptera physalus]
MLSFLDVITRSKKAQRPKACPQGVSEEPAGKDRLREAHSRNPRTHRKAPGPDSHLFSPRMSVKTTVPFAAVQAAPFTFSFLPRPLQAGER